MTGVIEKSGGIIGQMRNAFVTVSGIDNTLNLALQYQSFLMCIRYQLTQIKNGF